MNNKKYTISLLLMAISLVSAFAQTGISSPVSRYGFGQLSDLVVGKSAAMGGAGIGLRAGQEINAANPASYSAVDSLTFLFDAGVSLENTNFNNGTTRLNNKNAHFDYVVMQFRAFRKLGMAFGFTPYSRVGYNFGEEGEAITDIYGSVVPGFNYTGEGGITRAFLGMGWNPIAGLSVGVNGEYFFGDISHTISNAYSNTSVYSNVRAYTASISSLSLSWGVQYEQAVSKLDRITVGATFSAGHNVNNTAYRQDYLFNAATNLTEGSTTDSISNAFRMPASLGFGVAYTHARKWTVAADFMLQKWGGCKFPMTLSDGTFASQKGFLADRKKVSIGMEYTPNLMGRNYLKRVHYRLGGFYATQYARVGNYDPGKEYGLTAGFGLPIQNQWNNRSVVNLSAQYVHVKPSDSRLLVENQFRVCISMTFDERWFMKWKAE